MASLYIGSLVVVVLGMDDCVLGIVSFADESMCGYIYPARVQPEWLIGKGGLVKRFYVSL
jgi:hypothetical protein